MGVIHTMHKKYHVINLVFIVIFLFFIPSCSSDKTHKKPSIKFNTDTLTIFADESSSQVLFLTLENVDNENININWTSSDSSVATITPDINPVAARVQGISPGMVIIRASIDDLYAEVRVKVVMGEFLEVDQAKISLSLGKTTNIHARAHTNDITYSISNLNIASVSSTGLVTAKEEGTAVITVKAGSKVVYITLNVEEDGIDFDVEDDIVLKLDENPEMTLTLVKKGSINTDGGTWILDDDSVVSLITYDDYAIIKAKTSGLSKSTYIRYNLPSYGEIKRLITVKDIDLTLNLTPLTGIFKYNETSFKLTTSLEPVQTLERSKTRFHSSVEGLVDVSEDGVVTRNPDYIFENDEVHTYITAISEIDPEAKMTMSLLVENPKKGIKYIKDVESFNEIMNAKNREAEIYLESDIDLQGKVYNDAIMPSDFNGHFHGNSYKIYNFTAPGLFRNLNGTVENLHISGTMIGSQRGFIAIYMGSQAVARNLLIEVTFKKPSAYVSGVSLVGQASNIIIIGYNPDGIPLDQVTGSFVQTGTASDIYLYRHTNNIRPGSGVTLLTEETLKTANTFSHFDSNIWQFMDGMMPSLKKLQSEG